MIRVISLFCVVVSMVSIDIPTEWDAESVGRLAHPGDSILFTHVSGDLECTVFMEDEDGVSTVGVLESESEGELETVWFAGDEFASSVAARDAALDTVEGWLQSYADW